MREIKRISMTDSAVESIRESIESGTYDVGEKLPTEAKLCETLGVSRTTVREAVRVLGALGYVAMVPGKGAFVASLTGTKHGEDHWYDAENVQFYDFIEVRMAIETLAVRLSVERATDKQIKELKTIHQSFVEANEQQDSVRLIMLDELFHTKIISFTNNPLLININQQLLKSFRTYRTDSFMNETVYKNAVSPHERLVSCFEKHNASLAVKVMREHLDTTKSDMELIHNNCFQYGRKKAVDK